MVRAKTIEEHFKVHIMRFKNKWHAFRGGYGTDKPVIDIAQAYNLDTLWVRVAKALSHEQTNTLTNI